MADRMVRFAKGTHRKEGFGRVKFAERTVNAARFNRFPGSERGKNGGNPLGDHRLSRSGRTHHQQIVPAGSGDHRCPFRRLLTPYIRKINLVLIALLAPRLNVARIRIDRSASTKKLSRYAE